ncbi:MAG: STAS domain-containing protein [Bacteroidetes bacterium]|nr:STAS domain-containing protein [Bacteroidota bacterium]MBL6963817.1 STAS domain-containing protein [Bacteroidota bacterium]
MTSTKKSVSVHQLMKENKEGILKKWIKAQITSAGSRPELMNEEQLLGESGEFLSLLIEAISGNEFEDIHQKSFDKTRNFLSDLSSSRSTKGYSPTETANFLFSLKEVLSPVMANVYKTVPEKFVNEFANINSLLDKLGLFTFETFVKTREEVIGRQSRQIMDMATPIIQVWESILSVPLIGTLDSARTQIVMEKLLEKIVETKSKVAIIDITGVPTVDTMVAQHLMKTTEAIRLLGADSVVTGISAPIAQTMVQMGVEFKDIVTRSIMADGIRYALDKMGKTVQNR